MTTVSVNVYLTEDAAAKFVSAPTERTGRAVGWIKAGDATIMADNPAAARALRDACDELIAHEERVASETPAPSPVDPDAVPF